MLTAELTRLNTDGLVSILGLLKFLQCSLLVWNVCPDGNMHGIIYRHIGRTGLGWINGQKSPAFRRGKSGSPSVLCSKCPDALQLARPLSAQITPFDLPARGDRDPLYT